MSVFQSGSREHTLQDLRGRISGLRVRERRREVLPTGLLPLDGLFPEGGVPVGSVVEWICPKSGHAAASLAMRSASGLLQKHGCLAVIDQGNEFYPASAVIHGVPLSRILLVRISETSSTAGLGKKIESHLRGDAQHQWLWALEQTARSRGVRVVMAWLPRATSAIVRRLQLAVESSRVTVMLMRPAAALKQVSFADLRLMVERERSGLQKNSQADQIRVRLLKAKDGISDERSVRLWQRPDGNFLDTADTVDNR